MGRVMIVFDLELFEEIVFYFDGVYSFESMEVCVIWFL